MVMMGKLVMKDNGQNRQFEPQVFQTNRGRGQERCSCKKRGFQDRFRYILEEGQDMDKNIKVGQGMTRITGKITETI